MKIIVIYPTHREGRYFIDSHSMEYHTYLCGMGSDCREELERIIDDEKPDVAVMAGTCGAYFSSGLRLYDTVLVRHDYLNDEDFVADVVPLIFKIVDSNTVREISTSSDDARADIENMEGAFFIDVCRSRKVGCLELRTVSNSVAAPKSDWHIDEASEVLADDLYKLLKYIDK